MTNSPIAVLSTAHALPSVTLARGTTSTVEYWYDPSKPRPSKLVGSSNGLRRRAASARVLWWPSAFILRRSAIAPLVDELPKKLVKLVPVTLHEKAVAFDDNWVFLHVIATCPIDRKASTFGPHPDPDRLYGATAKRRKQKQPLRLAWREPPALPLFRLAEYPYVTCATRAFYEHVAAATKGKIVEAAPPYSKANPTSWPIDF